MNKMNKTEKVIELLKKNWMSNFQIQIALKSSSADRLARFVRKNPPAGYEMQQRVKDCDVWCYEYKLAEI